MMCKTRSFIPAAALLLAATVAQAAGDWPAPVRALQARGLEVIGRFDAPGGLAGYAAVLEQQPLSIYVTADGKHAVIGPMVDATGANLSDATLERMATAPMGERAWKQLEASSWIADGRASPRVVYAFMDPNCPYCGRFWKDARPWVDAGKVQVRHVMVGILGPTSGPKAAAILMAKDPAAALAQHERDRGGGGIKPPAKVDPAAQAKLDANQVLMRGLGFGGTPTILYRDAKGVVRNVQGAPSPEMMAAILGPR